MSMSILEGFKFTRLDTPLHNLDPRAKFIVILVFFGTALLFSNILILLLAFLVQIPLIFLSQSMRRWMKSVKSASILALLIFTLNFITGSPLIFSLSMAVRFLVLVSSFSTFFITTSPDDLGLALESIGIPYAISFTFTMAVRLVPTMAVDAQRVIDAQKSRGLELEKGNLFKRVRNYIPILIPLIVSAIRRSMEMAEALESRGFDTSGKRESMVILKLNRIDYIVISIAILIFVSLIYVKLYVPLPAFELPLRLKLF